MPGYKVALTFVAILTLASSTGCIQQRSADVLGKAERIVSETKSLLETLRSIHDEQTARASMDRASDGFAKVVAAVTALVESGKHADSRGGVTKSSAKKIEAETKTFMGLVTQIPQEVERLKGIRGLPREFWVKLRTAQLKYLDEYQKAFPQQIPANLGQFSRDVLALSARHSPERVVQIELEGARGLSESELVNKIRERVPGGEVVHLGAEGNFTIYVGPVDDFERFRQSLDFLDITNADEAQLCMDARSKSPALVNASSGPNRAQNEMERVRSEMNRLRGGRASRPTISRPGMPPSFADFGNGAATPEIPEHVRSTINEMEAARHVQLPDESDPEYYRKLADLIIDDNAHFSRRDAMAVLVGTNPNDIPDAEVRKQIARNFRSVVNDDRGGLDREKAIRGLVIYGGKYSAPMLIELIEKEELRVEPIALDALAAIKDPKGAEALVKLLGNFFNHQAAVSALRKIGSVAEPALIRVAPSNDSKVSIAAVELLGEVGTDKSLIVLRRAQDSRNSDVRLAAANSLRQISERKKAGEAIAADEPVDLFAMFSQPSPRRAKPRINAPSPSDSVPPPGSGTPSGNPALRRIN